MHSDPRAVNAFVFYGLSVNSTSMSGNKYINFALVSLVEIPGYTIAWVSIQKIGRRFSLVGSLLLCGLTCTLTLFVPSGNDLIQLEKRKKICFRYDVGCYSFISYW